MSVVLVTGGARSGKSSFAELIAAQSKQNVFYLATARAGDQEMQTRIELHQDRRPADWTTIEAPLAISNALTSIPDDSLVLMDCLTNYLANLMLENEDLTYTELEKRVLKLLKQFLMLIDKKNIELIVVANEVGTGIVPAYKSGRDFRDISGRAVRLIARTAKEVYLLVAGLPVEIKQIGMTNLSKYFESDEECKPL